MTTIDEQITALRNLEGPIAKAAADNLEKLKRIQSVQVPDEPACVGFVRARAENGNKEDAMVAKHIDTMRDLLRRESARADYNGGEWVKSVEGIVALHDKIAEKTRLLVEARGRLRGRLVHVKGCSVLDFNGDCSCGLAELRTRIDAAIKEQK